MGRGWEDEHTGESSAARDPEDTVASETASAEATAVVEAVPQKIEDDPSDVRPRLLTPPPTLTRHTTQSALLAVDDGFFAAVDEAALNLDAPPSRTVVPPPLRRTTKRMVAPTAVLGNPPVRRLVERAVTSTEVAPTEVAPTAQDSELVRARKATHQTVRGGPSPISAEEAAALRSLAAAEPATPRLENVEPAAVASADVPVARADGHRSASLVTIGVGEPAVGRLAAEDLEHPSGWRWSRTIPLGLAAAAVLLVAAWVGSRPRPSSATSVAASASVPAVPTRWRVPLSPDGVGPLSAEPSVAVPVVEDLASDDLGTRSVASRPRSRVRTAAAPPETPEEPPEIGEDPSPEPAPEPPPPAPSEPTPGEVFAEARLAFERGDYESAFRKAMQSKSASSGFAPADEAALLHLVARSGCRVGRKDTALEALRELPMRARSSVRRDCRREGQRLGV